MSRDISPSKEALSNRNLTLLLETLSKKETRKSIEALSKIDKDEWRDMAATATQLKSFVVLGGISSITTTLTESVKNTIELQIDKVLSPLQNQINQAITDIISPFIDDLLTPLINDLNDYLAENSFGAGVGGIAGNILASFLPGGNIWVVVFSALGAYLEDVIGRLLRGETGVDVWTTFADAAFARILELTNNLGAGDDDFLDRIGGFQDASYG